uniref:MYND-type domain-containing protein n=1 Tax=Anopheles atroparvus TaxID=41427 RepID=A0A182J3U2_ANOAO
MSLASSWVISRKNLTSNNLGAVRDAFKRDYWPFAKEKVEKSNPKATQLREQGNAAYKMAPDEPDRALELYNQSICMAEEDSEELGMGYANRSAIYFNRKMYRECLQNIRLAKRHHYPERMMAKLKEREERCLKMMANSPESSRKDEKGGKHCSMQSCLEMSDDSRGICTSRDLSVGEKVLLEKPFLLVLEPELAYQRCDYCGLRNGLNLRPCKTCTSVMYCSVDCQEQALQRYHQFECEVVADLKPLFRGPKPVRLLYLSLRLFWHCVLLYLEDPETFLERCKNRAALAQYRNPFTLEPSDYFYHLFLEGLENLAHKQRSRDVNDLTDRCVREFASVLMYVVAVEENTSLALRLEGKPANETLRDMLFVLVYQAERLADHRAPEMTCLYPFSRLLRHSCAPTAERFLHDLQSVIVLKRPVSKGQEITIAYR